MNGFKLIAIRPLIDCDTDLTKVLKKGEIYKFYNNYTFLNDKMLKVSEIENVRYLEYEHSISDTLYNTEDTKINISAIVGKNGFGKSTLLELFFLTVYFMAIEKDVLKKPTSRAELRKFKNLKKKLKIEIYFSINDSIYKISLGNNGDKFFKFDIIKTENKAEIRFVKIAKLLDEEINFELKNFCYSIAINYSIYGLNSLHIGNWIHELFHKNDAYQTPLVINPYRDEGNFNINTEIDLAKQRLISNLLSPNKNYEIAENQLIKGVILKLNKKKTEFAFSKTINNKRIDFNFNEIFNSDGSVVDTENIFKLIYESFKKVNLNLELFRLNPFYNEIKNYATKKLIKTARTYSKYGEYFKEYEEKKVGGKVGSTETIINVLPSNRFDNFEDYLNLLMKDESHITFKLRQIVNFLDNEILRKDKLCKWSKNNNRIVLPISILKDRIIALNINQEEIINNIPPPIFDVDFVLISKKNEKNKSLFSNLSSGEQQLIHSIQSVLYHIFNINSVIESAKIIKYKNVNIILDEIELYFHPDLQRKFINELIKGIKNISLPSIDSINILFSTHSPFILSDIPSQNILLLNLNQNLEAEPKTPNKQSFGSNIHELLTESFFLEKTYIGEFAQNKISEIIKFLKKEENDITDIEIKDTNNIINLIGEPIVRHKLNLNLKEKFPIHFLKGDNLESKILIQEEILRKLKNQKGNEDSK